ncbi:MAG: nuclease [Pseudoxanthomonas sp.]
MNKPRGNKLLAVALLAGAWAAAGTAQAWGGRGHAAIAAAAIDTLPDDGPVFLKRSRDYIAASAGTPDSWRGESEPFLKIDEDPNHGWFREQFAFMKHPPRSRYAFVLALYKQRQRIAASDPELARRMNVRWTGTLPYAAVEGYQRLVANMRQWRATRARGESTAFLEQSCAFYATWLAHYIGDGAQPLHSSIHHDGWQGPNPHGYTRDPSIHGRFESEYVEMIGLDERDLSSRYGAPTHQQGDVFEQILAFLDDSRGRVEQIYRLDKRGAFADPQDREAREAVYVSAAAGAAMLRDLIYRAWRESALPPPAPSRPGPVDPDNPGYDPETGSAPAPRSPQM